MVVVTRLPILPVIAIYKNDGSQYNFNHFTGTYDFRIQSLQCRPPVDSQGGTFTLNIVSSNASNSAANAFLGNISCGNKIVISLGKSASGLTKVLTGMIRDISIKESISNHMQIIITGPDWWSDIAKNRITSFARIQKPAASGIGYDNSDLNAVVSQIASDLIKLPTSYTFPDVTAEQQGIVVNLANIDPNLQGTNGTKVPQFISNFEKLDDKLSELDVWGSSIHYFDPDGNFYMRPAAIQPDPKGSWLFTDDPNDSISATWASGLVGFLAPSQEFKYTVESYKRRLIGTGGDLVSLDVSQETNSAFDTLSSTWLAIQFQPTFITAYSIQIYLASLGIPTQNLAFMLVQDRGGAPTGQVVKNLSLDKKNISNTPGWLSFNIGDQYQTSSKYWVVLPGNSGYGGINGYKWYKGGSTSVISTSPDGITWTPQSAVAGYMFRAMTSTPLKIAVGSTVSSTDKVFHEEVYRKPFITDKDAMQRYLTALTAMTNFKKEILKGRVYAPDTVPMPFANVLLRKTKSGLAFTGINNYFILGEVTYNFAGGDSEATGSFWIDFQLVRFTAFP